MTARGAIGAAVLGACAAAWPGPAGAQDPAPTPAAVQEKLNEGKRAYNAKQYDAARACFTEVWAADPTRFEAAWFTASTHVLESNPSAAQPWFLKASDCDPTHFCAAFEAGLSLRRYEKHGEALPYLRRAFEALGKATGLNPNAEKQTVHEYFLHAALVECLFTTKAEADCEAAAQAALAKFPECPPVHFYLGQLAEAKGDSVTACAHYKRCAEIKVEKPFAGHFHLYAFDDKKGEARELYRFLEETRPKYGTVDGARFTDAAKELTVDLPPKAPTWHFLFPTHAEPTPGTVETHVITIGRVGALGRHEVTITIHGGHDLNMNLSDGTKTKIDLPERFAEDLRGDRHRTHVEVADATPVKKATFGRGMKALTFAYTGKSKDAMEKFESAKAQNQRAVEPPTLQQHVWIVKGKKHTFWITVACREDFWKRFQKEIQAILQSVKFPS